MTQMLAGPSTRRTTSTSVTMWGGMGEALDAFEADASVRCVVLTGAGDKAFVSGADISQFPNLSSEDAVAFASFQNLKKKEAEGFFDNDRLRPRKAAEAGSFKVRSGKAGGWSAQFESVEAERIADYVARNLDPVFGYGASPNGKAAD